MLNIIIRTDASPEIGMGHVMRCLAISEQIRNNGDTVIFVLSNEYAKETVENKGFIVELIKKKENISDEIPALFCIVEMYSTQILLVDTYRADDFFLEKMQKVVAVYCLDGLLKCNAEISGVICFNPAVTLEQYKSRYEGKHTKLLIGSDYIPLRSEFVIKKNGVTRNGEERSVLLTTGSTDTLGIVPRLCQVWEERKIYEEIKLKVIVGSLFSSSINYRQNYPHIDFLFDVSNMSDIMQCSSLAIAQAGTTVYELLSQGVPVISFSINEIQKTFGYLDGVIEWHGDIRDVNDVSVSISKLENIINSTVLLVNNENKLNTYRSNGMNYCDGYGAYRIAKSLECKRR